jgi:hypothetical protein
VAWEVEVTDQFVEWYSTVDSSEVGAVQRAVTLLEISGPVLGRPHVDTISGSRHCNMKELRIQSSGNPLRVFFAFDPRRVAILLIGGDKTGDKLFYDRMILKADELYDEHLSEIDSEMENVDG